MSNPTKVSDELIDGLLAEIVKAKASVPSTALPTCELTGKLVEQLRGYDHSACMGAMIGALVSVMGSLGMLPRATGEYLQAASSMHAMIDRAAAQAGAPVASASTSVH